VENRIESDGKLNLSIQRFRPNIVVSGAGPWDEDKWLTIAVGNPLSPNQPLIRLKLVKPCDRCKIPTINLETGQRDGDEPLTTLQSKISLSGCFGQNVQHAALSIGSMLEVGMHVFVEEFKSEEFLKTEAEKMNLQ